MVRIARRDTYGLEDVGGGVKVRRRIFAGRPIPDHLDVAGDALEDTEAPPREAAEARPEPKAQQPKPTGRRPRKSG
jgi:hypothetical protein